MMHKMTKKLMILGLAAVMAAGAGACWKKATASSSANTALMDTKKDTDYPAVEHPTFIADGIRKVVLTKDGTELFYLSKEAKDYKMDFDYWEILNPYDEIATVNTETMYTLFNTFTSIDFSAPQTVGADVSTGIAESKSTMQIDYVNSTDSTTALDTQDPDSTVTMIIGSEDGAGNYYVALKGFEDQIYTVPTSTIDAIYSLNPFDYLLKIPALVNIDSVKAVQMTIDKKTYEISYADETFKFNNKEVEPAAYTTLYQALQAMIFTSEFTGEVPADSKEVLNIQYERNMDGAPEIAITYSTCDDTSDIISVNGTPKYLIAKEDVDNLVKQIEDAF